VNILVKVKQIGIFLEYICS